MSWPGTSGELARGVAELAGQVAGPEVRIEVAGGESGGTLDTDDGLVRDAICRANQGDGVIVLGELGSAILTARHLLERQSNGHAGSWTLRWSRAAPTAIPGDAGAAFSSRSAISSRWRRRGTSRRG